MRTIAVAIGVVIVLAAPFSLIDPIGFYNTLVEPSLVALWLSQLIVFAVYPLFASKQRQRALPAWTLSLIASGFAVYGLWTALHQACQLTAIPVREPRRLLHLGPDRTPRHAAKIRLG